MIKICVICGKVFDALGNSKACAGECREKYRIVGKRESDLRFYANNREQISEKARQRYMANPEPAKERARIRHKNNPRSHSWDAANPERVKELKRLWYVKNRDYVKMSVRLWLENNPNYFRNRCGAMRAPNWGTYNFLQTLKLGSTISKIENENTNHSNP